MATEAKKEPGIRRIIVPARLKPETASSWHSYLTIDLVVLAAQRTILNPFFAWALPLSLRAITVPYEHLSLQLTIAYAALITCYYIFTAIDQRIAYGQSREVELSSEVVVITGGAGGLGLLLADFYRMNGASVAIFDIKEPPTDGIQGIEFYKCDVGDAGQVQAAAERIKADIGTPTILINNAAIMNGKSILDLTPKDLEKTMRINLLSHYYTTQSFLPAMLASPNGGTIVTISSVLGHLGCAHLSDYTASKAGLLAFHASLRAELSLSTQPGASSIKTILVAPGQLGTSLFGGLKTPSTFLAPVVEPVQLAREIVRMVDAGDGGEVRMPVYAGWVPLLCALPASVQGAVRRWAGMDGAMVEFARKMG
ncbi:NAD(P)-binding protein [Microthyrium microscopicum]|uniref:NAD(P)-binding protein n=1 Tax=Microthyrium microscopicum TaxID=703497 RepID=A0A6A6UT41_9PEZI|nr:NAD(P)-binding protein [Microthyrium microscopicum]